MAVTFPAGAALSLSDDKLLQHLAGYMNSLFSIGLGFIFAYLYIDKFNERAAAKKFREVDAASLVRLDTEIANLTNSTISALFKKQDSALVEVVNSSVFKFITMHSTDFADDREAKLASFFDWVNENLQNIDPHTGIDESENKEFADFGRPIIDRMSIVIVPRLLMGQLSTEIKERLLIAEEEITNDFGSIDLASRQWNIFKGDSTKAAQNTAVVWIQLKMLLDRCFVLLMYLDDLQEGSAYRKFQKGSYKAFIPDDL